jgi:hypothetical protein
MHVHALAHAAASAALATAVYAAPTLQWEVAGIPPDAGQDIIWESIYCYPPASLAISMQRLTIATSTVYDVP